MKKILVTGNNGYVGPLVINKLLESYDNEQVFGLDNMYFNQTLDPKFFNNIDSVKTKKKDIRDINESDLIGFDCVIHLAAVSNDPMGKLFKKETNEINYLSTIKLAELAQKAGVRKFIFASSCSIYGSATGSAKKETDQINPLTDYATSKVMSENELSGLASPSFQIMALRFATACGYSPNLRLDLVLNDFIASAISDRKITVLSDGSPWRPLIHVKDMAKSIYWAMHHEQNENFIVLNVGSEEWTWQIRDLAYLVSGFFHEVDVSINTSAFPDKRSYKVDFSKFNKLTDGKLDFEKFDSAVEEFIEKTKHINLSSFRNSSYIRHNVLNELIKNKLITKELKRVSY